MSTEEKEFSYPCLFTFRNMQRDNLTSLLLWEWTVLVRKAECLLGRAEKSTENDFLYGSNSRNPSPGSATDFLRII